MSKASKSRITKAKFNDSNSILFSMGYVDLIFKLKLTNKDLLKPEEDQNKNEENDKKGQKTDDKYYNIEDFRSIEDLQFLKDKKELWDKITLSGGNDTLKQILIGNRIAKKKCKIEYFGYNVPKFEGNDEFFSDIFKYVCSKNNLIINETPLEENSRYGLKIILYHNGESSTISIGTTYEEEERERLKKKKKGKKTNQKKENEKQKSKKNSNKKKNPNENEEDDEEDSSDDEDENDNENQTEDDYEETEAMKAKKIPKFKRGSSILVKLTPSYEKYSLAYINYIDLKNAPGDFKLSDLNELLKFFKSKGTIIFVNYYKPKKPKIEVEEEEIDSHENDNEIKKEGATKNEENEQKEEEPKEEKKEKNEQSRPSKKMQNINELYDNTNIYFFDIKQCIKTFNKHYENFTDDNVNNFKKITRPKIFDYFIKGIAPATKEEVTGMKTGLFIDQLNKLKIIYASKKAANTQEFDCQPYPKINHNNMNLIQEYKNILKRNKNDYYSIFISSIIINCTTYAPGCQSNEIIYPSFLISLEVIKKKLECEKNDVIIDDNIYNVKLDEKIIKKNLEIISSGGKENGFVLDCTNKEKSTMKDYVSLYDYHLRTFFSSETIRKDLKNKGFINSKGFIMYDPEHRNVMRSNQNKKNKKKKVISNEEIMDSIKTIDVPFNIKDKEIDAEQMTKQKNSPTEVKLPVNKELMTLKTNVTKKKKKKRRNHRASSKGKSSEEYGSSDESDSGNNSGDNSGTVSGDEDEKENEKENKKDNSKEKDDDVKLLRDMLVYN